MKKVRMVCMMAILMLACVCMTNVGTASAKKAETVMGVYVDAELGDVDAAERLLTLAWVEEIEPSSITQLGTKYYQSGNHELGFQLWLSAANEGDAEAMKYVGQMYERGVGTEKDAEKAIAYYKMAAENGCIDALICLGEHYWYANGGLTEENIRTGMEYFLEAAERGNAEGMWNLGLAYLNLEAVKDSELALQWFDRAIEAGYELTVSSDQRNYQRAKEEQKNQKSTSANGGFFTSDNWADIRRESENSVFGKDFFTPDNWADIRRESENSVFGKDFFTPDNWADIRKESENSVFGKDFFTSDNWADIRKESEENAIGKDFFTPDSWKDILEQSTTDANEDAHKKCYFCDGSGICPYCHGRGRFYVTGYGYSPSTYYDCVQCEGSARCPHCSENGR